MPRQLARCAAPVSATFLLHAIKAVGAADVAMLAASPSFTTACRHEATRDDKPEGVAAALGLLASADPELIRTLLGGLRMPVFAPNPGDRGRRH